MKKQVVIIHGGSTYKTYKEYLTDLKSEKLDVNEKRSNETKRWKDTLDKKLGKNFQVIYPEMPGAENAQFVAWKIWFEKLFPHLHDGVILIGHSLGGIFLSVYLSKYGFPKKIKATMLVAAPHFDSSRKDIPKDWMLPKSLSKFERQGGKIFLYQSKDDKVVSFSHVKKYAKALPDAKLVIFKNKGHFRLKEFPEIVRDIKNVSKK